MADLRHGKRRRVEGDASDPTRRPEALPFQARQLSKHDLRTHQGLFGLYLDLQKQIRIEELDEREVKGRFKSFTNKWNRGELSEGYYDPAMKAKADGIRSQGDATTGANRRVNIGVQQGDDDDDDGAAYGPSLPHKKPQGAVVPNRDDLLERDEMAAAERVDVRAQQHIEHKAERRNQKERLEELAPRAAAGTRERQLEKKREKSDANRAFREARSPEAAEVGERDLMGEDGIEGFKARARENERRKTEREVRKEEMLRARAAEREVRLAAHRAKEDQTMDKLKALARERFG